MSESNSVGPVDPAAILDPLALFEAWFREAHQSEVNDPNAAALATATGSGVPSVRMVLIKPLPETPGQPRKLEDILCFFTNAESRKGRELAENPRAALCLHWKSLRRQIRAEGTITELPAAISDAYFHSRSRMSQIGAAVSQQSRTLASRAELEEKAQAFAAAHSPEAGEIPRPGYWRGFQLHPTRLEFWLDGPNRLHDRFLFTLEDGQWQKSRLYP